MSCPALAPGSPSASPGTRLAGPCWPQLLPEPLCAEAAVCARRHGAGPSLHPLPAQSLVRPADTSPGLVVYSQTSRPVRNGPRSLPALCQPSKAFLIYLILWGEAWQGAGAVFKPPDPRLSVLSLCMYDQHLQKFASEPRLWWSLASSLMVPMGKDGGGWPGAGLQSRPPSMQPQGCSGSGVLWQLLLCDRVCPPHRYKGLYAGAVMRPAVAASLCSG